MDLDEALVSTTSDTLLEGLGGFRDAGTTKKGSRPHWAWRQFKLSSRPLLPLFADLHTPQHTTSYRATMLPYTVVQAALSQHDPGG